MNPRIPPLLPRLLFALALSASLPAPFARAADATAGKGELTTIQDAMKASDAHRRALKAEIEALRVDRARFQAALVDTAKGLQETQAAHAASSAKLAALKTKLDAATRDLAAKRGETARLLAAMQRLGGDPPPAILADPTDLLKAIRAAMTLNGALPPLRARMAALATRLADLAKLRDGVAAETSRLATQQAALDRDRERLAALVAARQSAIAAGDSKVSDETARLADLAKRASDLKDLIARISAGATGASAAIAAAPGPTVAFAAAKAKLRPPVQGAVLRGFGADDGAGGTEQGVSFGAPSGATVTTPCDGKVAFAGPYRQYGRLLILDAGGGYDVVMAGMSSVDVAAGQFVIAGEPVGSMGAGDVPNAASVAVNSNGPVLFVEFRKDGSPVDPAPWWAPASLDKVSG
ncbi:MAG: peptidoglycan DD-metalloendopeptidase family protein [Hyphomicrobiales bacterium]|nr:peptidoglycan DD-metalloendopeptidase family protein [Hyphomicrobiales bacterium]MDE2017551.1 peptidoglycan DD-metalloendopeptidase family protein [Hyphomicrobiales bacterium]